MEAEKFIIIKSCTKKELKTMLNDWFVLYVNKLRSKMIFEIAEISPNIFILKVDITDYEKTITQSMSK